MLILIAAGIVATVFVYFGLQTSLLFPTYFSTPISPDEAVSIVAHNLNLTKYRTSDFSTRYVYLRGDGGIFASDINSNVIGKLIGKTQPTLTTGNYFAWEIRHNHNIYFLDSTTGEIVSPSNSSSSWP
jgi:hypothetical protein